MAKSKKEQIRIIYVKDMNDLPAIYAQLRKRRFTAEEWQKFTEIEPGIPAEQVVAELETLDREEAEKRQRRDESKKGKRKKA